jgi:hypothetical protein
MIYTAPTLYKCLLLIGFLTPYEDSLPSTRETRVDPETSDVLQSAPLTGPPSEFLIESLQETI